MTLLMGIDLETTGLDPAMDEIIEAGIVLWDTEPNRMVSSFSLLVSGVRVPEEIIYLTGITPKMRADFGAPIASILGEIEDAAKKMRLSGCPQCGL
jgi:DNA polymerase III, epsilon subunit and related 3'-5' exonucleases